MHQYRYCILAAFTDWVFPQLVESYQLPPVVISTFKGGTAVLVTLLCVYVTVVGTVSESVAHGVLAIAFLLHANRYGKRLSYSFFYLIDQMQKNSLGWLIRVVIYWNGDIGMQVNEKIIKWFEELKSLADKIEKEKLDIGKSYECYRINSELFVRWKTSVHSILIRVFSENSPQFKNFEKESRHENILYHNFRNCVGVFMSAFDDYRNGYLFDLQSEILAGFISDELEQAEELLKNGYKDIACVLCRIALESSMKKLSDKNGIPSNQKADKLNADLAKAGIYNSVVQKQVTAWLGIGNAGAHGNHGEYNIQDVKYMLEGIRQFIGIQL